MRLFLLFFLFTSQVFAYHDNDSIIADKVAAFWLENRCPSKLNDRANWATDFNSLNERLNEMTFPVGPYRQLTQKVINMVHPGKRVMTFITLDGAAQSLCGADHLMQIAQFTEQGAKKGKISKEQRKTIIEKILDRSRFVIYYENSYQMQKIGDLYLYLIKSNLVPFKSNIGGQIEDLNIGQRHVFQIMSSRALKLLKTAEARKAAKVLQRWLQQIKIDKEKWLDILVKLSPDPEVSTI